MCTCTQPHSPCAADPQAKDRVDIAKNNGSDVTGGYILDNEHGKTKQVGALLAGNKRGGPERCACILTAWAQASLWLQADWLCTGTACSRAARSAVPACTADASLLLLR